MLWHDIKECADMMSCILTGTDEHGQKIQRKAEEKGITPQQYVDEIVAGIKDLWKKLDISYDDFIRTTENDIKKLLRRYFKSCLKKEIFILISMKDGIAHHVNPSLQRVN